MCTVIFGQRVWPGVDIVVAANRDERLDRPSAPPAATSVGGVALFAPRDLESGGTWIGVNEHGVVVALTNRFGSGPRAGHRSRGEIVCDALGTASAREAAAALAHVAPATYPGFHCLIADSEFACTVRPVDDAMRVEQLEAGRLYAITERSYGAAGSGRESFLASVLADLAAGAEPQPADWRRLLSTHAGARLAMDGVCVHMDAMNYGTRTAELLRVAMDRASSDWHHMAGRPCVSEMDSLSEAMRTALKW
jgi:uncharacterized protein with NRDE domain